MKTVKVFINWDSHFVSTDVEETVSEFLKTADQTLKEYALENGIIDEDSELNDEQISVCYDEIFDDIFCELYGWTDREIITEK